MQSMFASTLVLEVPHYFRRLSSEMCCCRLCKRPGDLDLEVWSEMEANSEMDDTQEFVVEAIMDERRAGKRGKREFLIKWEVRIAPQSLRTL